jgi:hypothetical protein
MKKRKSKPRNSRRATDPLGQIRPMDKGIVSVRVVGHPDSPLICDRATMLFLRELAKEL